MLEDAAFVLEGDLLSRQDAAEAELKTMAGGAEDRGEGPVAMGDGASLVTKDAIRKMAALYQSAFQCGSRVYPYFRATA